MSPACETLCCWVGDSGRKTDEAAWPAPTVLLAYSYYWRELPQVSFLSRQTRVCRDKTPLSSWQKYACRDTYFSRDNFFVATSLGRDKHNFVEPKLLSRHTYFCRDKHVFVATKYLFCHDKSMLVAKNTCLSRQIYFVVTNIILSRQNFVAASILLSRQKACFVPRKIILVAAPANDTGASPNNHVHWSKTITYCGANRNDSFSMEATRLGLHARAAALRLGAVIQNRSTGTEVATYQGRSGFQTTTIATKSHKLLELRHDHRLFVCVIIFHYLAYLF